MSRLSPSKAQLVPTAILTLVDAEQLDHVLLT